MTRTLSQRGVIYYWSIVSHVVLVCLFLTLNIFGVSIVLTLNKEMLDEKCLFDPFILILGALLWRLQISNTWK